MSELKDSAMGLVEIDRAWVKILVDELLIAKAREGKLEVPTTRNPRQKNSKVRSPRNKVTSPT